MMTSARNWNMSGYGKDKTYGRDGKSYKGIIQQNRESFNINFIEVGDSTNESSLNPPTAKGTDKKPWWKAW
jgi:hypothetical protein